MDWIFGVALLIFAAVVASIFRDMSRCAHSSIYRCCVCRLFDGKRKF